MLSRDGAPVASRLSGAGEHRGIRDRPGDVVAIKPPIKRNGFAVAVRNLRSGLVESAFRIISRRRRYASRLQRRILRRSKQTCVLQWPPSVSEMFSADGLQADPPVFRSD